ncbi:MAG: outer membrane beta-barrel protein [Bacteroidales bacterium]|nr:outer membrane beta-barrel protein [Bacteroidales bacterium]
MIRNYSLIILLSLFAFSKPSQLNAQQHKFIGGVLVSIDGIGLVGESGQFWNSSNEKEGGGHGGISAGIFVKREFTRKLYSILELRYIHKGSIYEYVNQDGLQSFENLYLNYMELPVLIGYRLEPQKRTFYFETGIAFAKLISSRIEADENYLLNKIENPDTKDFKNIDISWIGSLKYPLIKKWKNNCLLGIRISCSILTIHKNYKIYNLNYGILFNYIFN